MNNIKELHPKEGVVLLAVKDAPFLNGRLVSHKISKIVYDAGIEFDYTILGTPDRITEEVWMGIVLESTPPNCNGLYYKDYTKVRDFLATARQSGLSFLKANEVYSVNPFPFPGCKCSWDDKKEVRDKCEADNQQWSKAEANTGTWVLLLRA